MTEKNKKPQIRFKGFTAPWEQRKLTDEVELFSGLTYSPNDIVKDNGTLVLRSSNVKNGEVIDADNVYVNSDVVNSSNVKNGDIIVVVRNGSRSLIGKHAQVKGEKDYTVIGAFMTGIRSEYSNFINALLDTPMFKGEIDKNLGATINQITNGMFHQMKFMIPKPEEQDKIGEIFTGIDKLINLHQRKYYKLQNVKKSMLEKMFPKNRNNTPEIRFKGFADPWERRKLGELSDSFEYGLNAASTEYDGENKYIRITDIDDESRRFVESDLTSPKIDLSNAENYKLKIGDILFARTGASVGKSYIYNESDGLVYYAGFLIRTRIKPEYSTEFVFQSTLTSQYNDYIRINSQRSGQPGVNAQEYAEFRFLIPEFDEQCKIGTFFRNLDNLITLHQRELDKLKNMKKACLEKMFI